MDHMADDLDPFNTILVLNVFSYAHFNFTVKQSYKCTSKRLKTQIGDTVQHLDISLSRQQLSAITQKQSNLSQISSGKSPALSQSNAGLVRN